MRGAGVDATILTADALPATAGFMRTLISGYMPRLADLTLRLPSAVTSGPSSAQGADVYDGVVENVRVDALGASFGAGINDGSAQGLLVRRGSLHNVEVDLGVDSDSVGIALGGIGGPGVTLEDVDATARYTMYSQPQADPGPVTMVARRLRLAGQVPMSVNDGFLELSDSVIDASSAPQQGEFTAVSVADGRPPSPAGLTLDRVTLVGNGGGESAALSVAGQGSPTPTLLRARHVTASGFGFTLSHGEFGGDAVARIDYSNLDLTPADILDVGSGSGLGSLIADFGPGNRGGDPLFRDPGAGNFALLGGSPAIDIGGDDLLAGGPTDLAGDPALATATATATAPPPTTRAPSSSSTTR